MIYKLAILLFAFTCAVYGNMDGSEETAEFPHAIGSVYVEPRNIQKGCARFYISDPIKETSGTKYWQVCTKVDRDHPAKMSIGSGVFAKIKDSYGQESQNSISFISTGPSAWVDIYAQDSQGGAHYEITPLRDVDLSLVTSMDNPDETTFNDNILSGFIRSSSGLSENPDGLLMDVGQEPHSVWYRFVGTGRIEPESGCAYFYDSDPNESENVNGFVTCVSHDQHFAHTSLKDMEDRGQILLGPQPYVNGTISDRQTPQAGVPQDENGNPLEPEPWEGDMEHEKEANKKYGRKSHFRMAKRRSLRRLVDEEEAPAPMKPAHAPVNGTHNETILEVIEEDLEMAWEEVVEGFDWLFSSIVHVFIGENTTTHAAAVAPTSAAAPAEDATTEDHTGIKFIEAGPEVDIAVWTNDNFAGAQTMIKSGSSVSVDHVVNSFFLVSTKYHANVPKPEGGYADIDENPVVPQQLEANKVTKIAKKMAKKDDYTKFHSKSARQAHMMRNS